MDSFDILKALKKRYEIPKETPFWWPEAGSFEVAVGAILVQRTKWENVQKSLQNLHLKEAMDMEKLAFMDEMILSSLIRPCGFYRQKAKKLKLLCENILEDFGDFESFSANVSRDWLLNQKGVGFESADAILNYACKREVFVVDSYLSRILKHFGFCFEEYEQIQEWVINGLDERVYELYPKEMELAQIYARFHGKIVMFCKEHKNESAMEFFFDGI